MHTQASDIPAVHSGSDDPGRHMANFSSEPLGLLTRLWIPQAYSTPVSVFRQKTIASWHCPNQSSARAAALASWPHKWEDQPITHLRYRCLPSQG